MGKGNSIKSYSDFTDIFSLNLRVRRSNIYRAQCELRMSVTTN